MSNSPNTPGTISTGQIEKWIADGEKATRGVYWEYTGDLKEELALFWTNPWHGNKEKIATFWWPGHPIEATAEAEKRYEEIADRISHSQNFIPLCREVIELRAENAQAKILLERAHLLLYAIGNYNEVILWQSDFENFHGGEENG